MNNEVKARLEKARTVIERIHSGVDSNKVLMSIILCLFILSSVLLKNGIPVVILIAYSVFFNKKYIMPLLLSFPVYDAYIGGGWFSANKAGLLILIVVLLINISIKKLKFGFNEWLVVALAGVISFSFIVALTNPVFAFTRDGMMSQLLLNNVPKIMFIMVFILAVRSSGKFDLRSMSDVSTVFLPVFALIIAVPAFLSKTGISIFEERFVILNSDPNFFSLFLVPIIPFGIMSILKPGKPAVRIVSLLGLGAAYFLIAIAASKTGYVLAFVATLMSVILFIRNKKIILYAAPAFIAAGVLAFIFIEPLWNIATGIFSGDFASTTDRLLTGRTQLFSTAMMHFLKNPILGYGGIKEASAILIYNYSGLSRISHNAYMDMAISYGLFGLLIYAAIYIRIGSDFIIKLFSKSKEYIWQYPVYVIFTCLLLAGFVLSLNFVDFQIYILTFLLAMPAIKKKEAADGV